MRVVVSEFISLDGVMQAPGGPDEDTSGGLGHGGWSMRYFDPEVMGAVIAKFAERSDALLQGRRTYQVSAAAWPERSGKFADWINGAQKYVVSDTLTEADTTSWTPTAIIRGADLVKEVSMLRDQPGGDIYGYGSCTEAAADRGTPDLPADYERCDFAWPEQRTRCGSPSSARVKPRVMSGTISFLRRQPGRASRQPHRAACPPPPPRRRRANDLVSDLVRA